MHKHAQSFLRQTVEARRQEPHIYLRPFTSSSEFSTHELAINQILCSLTGDATSYFNVVCSDIIRLIVAVITFNENCLRMTDTRFVGVVMHMNRLNVASFLKEHGHPTIIPEDCSILSVSQDGTTVLLRSEFTRNLYAYVLHPTSDAGTVLWNLESEHSYQLSDNKYFMPNNEYCIVYPNNCPLSKSVYRCGQRVDIKSTDNIIPHLHLVIENGSFLCIKTIDNSMFSSSLICDSCIRPIDASCDFECNYVISIDNSYRDEVDVSPLHSLGICQSCIYTHTYSVSVFNGALDKVLYTAHCYSEIMVRATIDKLGVLVICCGTESAVADSKKRSYHLAFSIVDIINNTSCIVDGGIYITDYDSVQTHEHSLLITPGGNVMVVFN